MMSVKTGVQSSSLVPTDSCDCHIHVLDFSPGATTVPVLAAHSAWADYKEEAEEAGVERFIIVQPSFYGFNNSFLVQTLRSSGVRARGVAVVPPSVPESVLAELHDAGVRGVRFNLVSGGLGLQSLAEIAEKIRPYGWHVQIFTDSASLDELMPIFLDLGIDCVFDHMATASRDADIGEPGFKALLRGMDSGRVWVKLSSALFPLNLERARLIIQRNDKRVVWGSDWPHVIYDGQSDDIRTLISNVVALAGNSEIVRRIFCDNPQELYFS